MINRHTDRLLPPNKVIHLCRRKPYQASEAWKHRKKPAMEPARRAAAQICVIQNLHQYWEQRSPRRDLGFPHRDTGRIYV